ncbi:uncharacterized protein LY79DRAFT_560697 [Colletotrichum navitas]|uniref:Subtilisin-like serine protease n=1 Tax=Colletotrichum navitas TaxID=681940 RepID=A0AAD8V391_9PEZI|nr:uncharacterized protein LY79DRAFT_560697 [Colletotrichum navitas]KAK1580704.1 hypothetical protein LY79DRAFT_560697 [Colletotrichum navitas]
MLSFQNPPFEVDHQLLPDSGVARETAHHVPGHPRIRLDDQEKVRQFLTTEFCNDDLDAMADKLWWMSKQDSRNISPLHRQIVKRRTIVITEDPKLHLVWINDRIFIKPLPRYLGSHAFWRHHLGAENGSKGNEGRVRRAALGFIRTYHYLIKYECDFRIAQDHSLSLIPADITWTQFCNFTSRLADIQDRDVSQRYNYGEIRLTRLNFYAPLLLRKSHFQRVEYQYGPYLARFYVPILFVMGVISVVLSGLQVIIAVGEGSGGGDGGGATADNVALWFSVLMILVSCGVLVALGALVAYKVVKEWNVAIRDRRRLMRERHKDKTLAAACP